ncbi:MAG: hypothetical protein ABWY10_11205 [Tardiphaga sp.]
MQTSGRSPPSPHQTVGIWLGFGGAPGRLGRGPLHRTSFSSCFREALAKSHAPPFALTGRASPAPIRLRVGVPNRLLRDRVRHGSHARGLRRRSGLDKIGRFRLDPRDTRSDADDYELVGDDSGVFGWMSLLDVTTSVRMTCHRRHRLFVFAGRWLWNG